MKIEVLYFTGCPNYEPALNRVKNILRRECLQEEIASIEVQDEAAAKRLKFLGSPTIRVNGLDIEPEARTRQDAGFACRRYPGGLPSEEMIQRALKEAMEP